MKCQKCQHELKPDAKFCKNCGSKVEQPPASTNVAVNKCPICNKEMKPGARFCPSCGAQCESNYASISQTGGYTSTPTQAYNTAAPQQTGNGNKTALIIVIIISAVVTVSLSIFAMFMFLSSNKERSEEIIVESPETQISEEEIEVAEEKEEEPTSPYAYWDEYEDTDGYEYFFPSDRRYVTASDLSGLGQEEVAMIRNEIYARHGYIFQTEPYKSYFSARPWYVPNPYFSEAEFNEIEKANKEFIVQYEKDRGWR